MHLTRYHGVLAPHSALCAQVTPAGRTACGKAAGMQVRQAVAHAGGYERHRPETTLLYQVAQRYYPAYIASLAAPARRLPG